MRITLQPRRKPDGYIILMMVLCFALASLIILGGTLNRQASTSLMNEHNNQYMVTIEAAEAATEQILARIIIDNRNGGDALVFNNLGSYQTNVPNANDNPYWGNFTFSDAQGNLGHTYISRTVKSTTNFVTLGFQYQGLTGYASTYRIISDASLNDGRFRTMTNCVQQDVQTAQIPLFQFAIFYNSLLNFVDCAPMNVRGPVHANGSIYTAPGGSSTLTFYNDISASGMIELLPTSSSGTYQNYGGFSSTALNMSSSSVTYDGLVETNTSTLSLPIGTNNTSAAVLQVLYPPPPGGDTNMTMYTNRFYNKAEMIILVSNSSVTATVQLPLGQTTTPASIPWSNNLSYFLNTNVSFTDQREGSTMKLTQIDIGKYNTWAYTNASVGSTIGVNDGGSMVPNVLYVGDFRTSAIATNEFAIRVTNGMTLPTNNTSPQGLTIATPNQLYILRNYNVPNSPTYLNTTNPTASMPASFLADAITVLSQQWANSNYDSISSQTYTKRPASTTTINAAMVAGVVYSTGTNGSTWDGGVENFPRLLEDWSNVTNTLNTSIINLFGSAIATNIFQLPGHYYDPPTRNWTFDNYHFSNPATQPPGTPYLYPTIRLDWDNPPPNTTNYTGW
jgi:hypothetical protein